MQPHINPRLSHPKPPREGDKTQARQRVRYLVRRGSLPRASTLPCTHCGAPAVEYDHHLGYGVDHHEDVQPVCRSCNIRLGYERGEHRPHGKPRIAACRICGRERGPFRRGRCERCRDYFRRHGTEYLLAPDA